MTELPTPKRFAVIGNPVAHSRSPAIHEQFAQQLGLSLRYDIIQAPLDQFAQTVNAFFADGGSGLNVTVPFKEQAWQLAADKLSTRARIAGAVNTLWMEHGQLHGCNTDGIGLLADINRLGLTPKGKKILLVGAGGAAKGAIYPLLEAQCDTLCIVNRTPERALSLLAYLGATLPQFTSRLSGGGLDLAQGQWDIIINATSSSLGSQAPDIDHASYADGALAYDMVYAANPTPFMQQARQRGAHHIADGLGMLVAQAAASFAIWNGLQPNIEPVLALLRSQMHAA